MRREPVVDWFYSGTGASPFRTFAWLPSRPLPLPSFVLFFGQNYALRFPRLSLHGGVPGSDLRAQRGDPWPRYFCTFGLSLSLCTFCTPFWNFLLVFVFDCLTLVEDQHPVHYFWST